MDGRYHGPPAAEVEALSKHAGVSRVLAELLLLLQQTGALKDALDSLLGQKKALPTEDVQPLPIPNEDRRQYLTGVRLEGERVLFLLRVSGSMLGESIEDAVARLGDPDFKKREAPKVGRNDPCPCGSGKKYKQCHGQIA